MTENSRKSIRQRLLVLVSALPDGGDYEHASVTSLVDRLVAAWESKEIYVRVNHSKRVDE